MKYRFLGIDPAPSKKSVVFDGRGFKAFDFKGLKDYVNSQAELYSDSLIIAWDAPLGECFESMSQKPIEKLLNTKKSYIKNKPPKGISTLPFASCPHWAVSQYVLGYPIVNKEIINKDKLKFHLIQSPEDLKSQKPKVVETHPAFSLWVYLKDVLSDEDFVYKKSKTVFKMVVDQLFEIGLFKKYINFKEEIMNTGDDYLDAFICYCNLEFIQSGKTKIYGNRKTGSMLLPDLQGVLNKTVLKEVEND